MEAAAILAHLAQARRSIDEALDGWQPASLEAVATAGRLFEQAVSELQIVEPHLRGCTGALAGAARREALSLQAAAGRAMRLTDAAAAFYRGLALRAGCAGPAYDGFGRLPDAAAGAELSSIG